MRQCYTLLKQKTKEERIVEKSDYLCFHTPFYKMIQKAFDALVKVDRSNAAPEEIGAEFKKKVEPGLFVSKRIGNIYTGSLYASLISLLYQTPKISNKNLVLFSYGSGLCSTIMQAHIVSNPLSSSQIADIDNSFKNRICVPAEEYSKVMKYKEETFGKWKGKIDVRLDLQDNNTYYLDEIDAKWRRSYKLKQMQGEVLVKKNVSASNVIDRLDKRIPKTEQKSFYKMTIEERRDTINKKLTSDLDSSLLTGGGIDCEQGDKIIENVIGKLSLPLGVVPMLLINNKKYMVPMSIEEPSVIAATSSIGKFFYPHSFVSSSTPSMMIGQVQLIHAEASEINQILQRKESIVH